MHKRTTILFLLTLVVLAIPLSSQDANLFGFPPQLLVPEIISIREHDPTAFTQGLLVANGTLYESTGLNGQSTLREVNPETGEVIKSIPISDEYFAEGLELVDNHLIQLTWKSEVAFVYDVETFEQVDTYEYSGEGWGLCDGGDYLYMSDGSPFLSVRDPETFELIVKSLVTVGGQPISLALRQSIDNGLLNELECVGDYVYANVWQTDFIVQINKIDGNVVSIIDASNLRAQFTEEELVTFDVLNGIAYLPESDTFLLTGKRWSKMFEVRFVEAEE